MKKILFSGILSLSLLSPLLAQSCFASVYDDGKTVSNQSGNAIDKWTEKNGFRVFNNLSELEEAFVQDIWQIYEDYAPGSNYLFYLFDYTEFGEHNSIVVEESDYISDVFGVYLKKIEYEGVNFVQFNSYIYLWSKNWTYEIREEHLVLRNSYVSVVNWEW